MTERPHTWMTRRLTRVDLAIHAGVGAVLILCYLLPIPYEAFLYTPTESHLAITYLSKLGHASLRHLLENLLAFVTVSLFALTLLSGASKRRLYYQCFLALFVIVPPLSGVVIGAGLSMIAPSTVGIYRGAGFSTVGAAFLGLLAAAIALQQRQVAGLWLRPTFSMGGLLALGLTYPALIYGWPTPIAICLASGAAVYLVLVFNHIHTTVAEPTAETPVMMSLFATIYYIGIAVTLFPRTPGSVGVGAHLVGLCAGFLVVWLVIGWTAVGSRQPWRSKHEW